MDAAASGAREVAGRALPVSDAAARGRPMLIPPAPELRRMGTTPADGFGDKRSRTVKSCGPDASVVGVKLVVAWRPDRARRP